ncbi:MAG TPA: Crp/Fnr family transcriptional regulator [Fimbriimonadaceae bacterium]|nr:Crp/Fnr family transcriptional regulator [Fimbriimonadaceae bacterium]
MASAERGETIWINGSQVEFYGLVGAGFVKMVRSMGPGHQTTFEVFGPGQIFGLLGMIEGTGCPLMARAVCFTWYLKIPKAAFLPIYDNNRLLRASLLKRTTHRFRERMEIMAHLSTGSVEAKIAVILLLLAQSYGEETSAGVRLQMPLMRRDLAEMAGTTVESAIRVFSRWQRSGLVRTDDHYVTIIDTDELKRSSFE